MVEVLTFSQRYPESRDRPDACVFPGRCQHSCEVHHINYIGTENAYTEAVRGSKSNRQRQRFLILLYLYD